MAGKRRRSGGTKSTGRKGGTPSAPTSTTMTPEANKRQRLSLTTYSSPFSSSSPLNWPGIKGFLSLYHRSLNHLVPPHGSWMANIFNHWKKRWGNNLSTLLRGHHGLPALEEPVPFWSYARDASFEIFDYLDMHGLGILSCTCKDLQSAVRDYSTFLANRKYPNVLVGTRGRDEIKYGVGATHSPGALYFLEAYGEQLSSQLSLLPACDCLETIQVDESLPDHRITRHMRAILVDWLIEVSVEYKLSSKVLHCAVNLLDRCLSSFVVPKAKLQLLGCIALMIESERGSPGHRMTIDNVVYITDGQYNGFQWHEVNWVLSNKEMVDYQMEYLKVLAMYNVIVSNVEDPILPLSAPTAHTFLTTWLGKMGLTNLTDDLPGAGRGHEEVILANFFADLALLDYRILQYRPSTVAASIIFFTRATLHYFANERLYVTWQGLRTVKSRELASILRHAWPFVEGYNRYQLGPWGLRTLGQFVLSSKEESLACASCVHRLYLLHRDYHFHVNKIGETAFVLRSHSYMLKGIQDRYAKPDTDRAEAWKRLGCIPESQLTSWITKHLRVNIPLSLPAPATPSTEQQQQQQQQ